MYHFQHSHCSRRSDGPAAHDGVVKTHGFAVSTEEKTFVRGRWSGFPTIKSLNICPIEVHQERTAANAAALWLNQGQYHLHRNGGIYGAATSPKHLVPRIGGQRVRRGDCKSLG
jgi:hypothetical protein